MQMIKADKKKRQNHIKAWQIKRMKAIKEDEPHEKELETDSYLKCYVICVIFDFCSIWPY